MGDEKLRNLNRGLAPAAQHLLDTDEAGEERWYATNRPQLEAIAARASADLRRLREAAPDLVLMTETRVKTFEAFSEKLSRLRARHARGETVGPMEVLGDLVGVRAVLFHEEDAIVAIAHYAGEPEFLVDHAEVYSNLPEGSALQHSGFSRILDFLSEATGVRPIPEARRSGYESIHLTYWYDREWLQLAADPEAGPCLAEHTINGFPVELQVRSILQHWWAELEHRLSYEQRRRITDGSDGGSARSLFMILMQQLMGVSRLSMELEDQSRAAFAPARSISPALAPAEMRLIFFDEDERAILESIHERLPRQPGEASLRDLWQAWRQIEPGERRMTIPREPRDWARRRVFLIYLGYLAVIGDGATRSQIRETFQCLWPGFRQGRLLAHWTFRYIQRVDAQFYRIPEEDSVPAAFFRDPLIAYRLAGAYLREVGDYSRALHQMEIALSYYEEGRKSGLWVHGGALLNEAHLLRRTAEYHFGIHRQRRGRDADQHVHEAREAARRAFESEDLPEDPDLAVHERQRIVWNLVKVEFFRAIRMSAPGTGRTHFVRSLEGVEAEIIESLWTPGLESNSRALAARALWQWGTGDMERAFHWITQAQQALRPGGVELLEGVVGEIHRFLRGAVSARGGSAS